MSAPGTVRVLQITDPHMTAREGERIHENDPYRSLQRVLEAALDRAEPPELILATGDLSADGSARSYERLRELLLATGLRCYVLAGNHDSADELGRTLVGGPIEAGPIVDRDGWRFVLLDSVVEREMFGRLADSQLELLEQALATAGERKLVVCVHHGPLRPCPSKGCWLLNDDELRRRVEAHPAVRVVLAGHAHLELERTSDHVLYLTTPSTNTQSRHAQAGEPVDFDDFDACHFLDPSRHGFRLLTLGPDDEVQTEVVYLHALAVD